jgi:streptogramin lyase
MATLLVPLVVGSAAAAPPGSRPAVTVAATVTGASVSVTANVNRGTGDLASCSYVIDTGGATQCVAPFADGKKASHYAITLSSQSLGVHTITVTVRLKDGGSGSGSTSTRPRPFRELRRSARPRPQMPRRP